MRRTFAIAAAAILLLAGGAYLAAPAAVRYVAEGKVDRALERIRVQSTSVVNRGEVSVDLASWTVKVKDISIEGSPGEARTHVGAVTFVSPRTVDGRLNADRIVLEDVTVAAAGETTSIPNIEIVGYSGPERGLTATPGVGRNARSQADIIAKVSFDRASIPAIVISNDRTQIRRTAKNVAVDRVVEGVIQRATVEGLAIEAPYVKPQDASATASIAISTGGIAYEELSLPTLWRFYAGDGRGDREQLAKSVSVVDVKVEASLRPPGRFSASFGRLSIGGLETRSLGYPLTMLDPIAVRARLGGAATPADIRQQLMLAVDGSRAAAFDEIAVEGVRADLEFEGFSKRSLRVDRAALDGYADGMLQSAKLSGFAYDASGGERLALAEGEAERLDARGLVAYAERVGRNEVLMTTSPTAEDVVRIVPRVARLDAKAFDAANSEGAIKMGSARIDIDAPTDAVPQRFRVKLDGVDATPTKDTRVERLLRTVEVEGLKGSAGLSLTFDPSEKVLSLDWLDYRFEQLGSIKAKGELVAVDPLLAVATGASFVDRVTAVRLAPFRFWAEDDGAMAVLLRRAAETAGAPPEEYRETVARRTEETILRVFGPPAENSAKSAAQFIRDPRTVEVIVTPRNTEQSLIDFVRAFDLGPEGLAQTIELAVLYRR